MYKKRPMKHKKITKKQLSEVRGLEEYGNFTASDDEILDYLCSTVHGKGTVSDKFSTNRLRNAKMRLQVISRYWLEDMENGTLLRDELLDEFQTEYMRRFIHKLSQTSIPSGLSMGEYCVSLSNLLRL